MSNGALCKIAWAKHEERWKSTTKLDSNNIIPSNNEALMKGIHFRVRTHKKRDRKNSKPHSFPLSSILEHTMLYSPSSVFLFLPCSSSTLLFLMTKCAAAKESRRRRFHFTFYALFHPAIERENIFIPKLIAQNNINYLNNQIVAHSQYSRIYSSDSIPNRILCVFTERALPLRPKSPFHPTWKVRGLSLSSACWRERGESPLKGKASNAGWGKEDKLMAY